MIIIDQLSMSVTVKGFDKRLEEAYAKYEYARDEVRKAKSRLVISTPDRYKELTRAKEMYDSALLEISAIIKEHEAAKILEDNFELARLT